METDSGKEKFSQALENRVIKNLRNNNLLFASEAFGAIIEDASMDASTCSEDDFIHRTLKIAEITDDKMLAKNARQRLQYAGIKYSLSAALISTLNIYAQGLTPLLDNKRISESDNPDDFPQWYNLAQAKAENIFTASALDTIISMICNRDRKQRTGLLCKLINRCIDSEIVRISRFYTDRDNAVRVLDLYLDKLKELLLIRELIDSSLEIGQDPEELVPYATSNIIKSLLNYNIVRAIDNINALAYFHYVVQERNHKSIDANKNFSNGTFFDSEKDIAFLKNNDKYTWPILIRKMSADLPVVKTLMKYRFAHGLITLNTALAYRYAEKGSEVKLKTGEKDAVVLNGLALTQTGYIKSVSVNDDGIRNQFYIDIDTFKIIRKIVSKRNVGSFFRVREKIEHQRAKLADKLENTIPYIDEMTREKENRNESLYDEITKIESKQRRHRKSWLKKLMRSVMPSAYDKDKKRKKKEISENKVTINQLSELNTMHHEMKFFFKEIAQLFH
ncbi:hypothetical protein QUF75_12660 [Desulfococcaceae bacterium HSG7]|nr:hypothetical protein [Desulfococcaceae bacterium HSG7]